MAVDAEEGRVERHEIAGVRPEKLVAIGCGKSEQPIGEGQRCWSRAVALVGGKSAEVCGGSRALYLNGQVGASITRQDRGSAAGLKAALERDLDRS